MMMLEREAGAKSYRALKPTLRGYFYTRALRRMILTGALHGLISLYCKLTLAVLQKTDYR